MVNILRTLKYLSPVTSRKELGKIAEDIVVNKRASIRQWQSVLYITICEGKNYEIDLPTGNIKFVEESEPFYCTESFALDDLYEHFNPSDTLGKETIQRAQELSSLSVLTIKDRSIIARNMSGYVSITLRFKPDKTLKLGKIVGVGECREHDANRRILARNNELSGEELIAHYVYKRCPYDDVISYGLLLSKVLSAVEKYGRAEFHSNYVQLNDFDKEPLLLENLSPATLARIVNPKVRNCKIIEYAKMIIVRNTNGNYRFIFCSSDSTTTAVDYDDVRRELLRAF